MTSAVESEPDPKFPAAGRSAGADAAIHRPGLAGRERRRRRFLRAAVTTHTRAPWHICTHTRERRQWRVSYLENSIDRSIRKTTRTTSHRSIIRVSCARARAEDTRRPLGPLSFSSSCASPSRTCVYLLHPSSSSFFSSPLPLPFSFTLPDAPAHCHACNVHRHAAPHTRIDTARRRITETHVSFFLFLLGLFFASPLPLRSLWKGWEMCRINAPARSVTNVAAVWSARRTHAIRASLSACARDNFTRCHRARKTNLTWPIRKAKESFCEFFSLLFYKIFFKHNCSHL